MADLIYNPTRNTRPRGYYGPFESNGHLYVVLDYSTDQVAVFKSNSLTGETWSIVDSLNSPVIEYFGQCFDGRYIYIFGTINNEFLLATFDTYIDAYLNSSVGPTITRTAYDELYAAITAKIIDNITYVMYHQRSIAIGDTINYFIYNNSWGTPTEITSSYPSASYPLDFFKLGGVIYALHFYKDSLGEHRLKCFNLSTQVTTDLVIWPSGGAVNKTGIITYTFSTYVLIGYEAPDGTASVLKVNSDLSTEVFSLGQVQSTSETYPRGAFFAEVEGSLYAFYDIFDTGIDNLYARKWNGVSWETAKLVKDFIADPSPYTGIDQYSHYWSATGLSDGTVALAVDFMPPDLGVHGSPTYFYSISLLINDFSVNIGDSLTLRDAISRSYPLDDCISLLASLDPHTIPTAPLMGVYDGVGDPIPVASAPRALPEIDEFIYCIPDDEEVLNSCGTTIYVPTE